MKQMIIRATKTYWFTFFVLAISLMLLVAFAVSQEEKVLNETFFELVPNTTEPEANNVLWIPLSSENPPAIIYYRYDDKTIEYIPKPESNDPKLTYTSDVKVTCSMGGCDGTCIVCEPEPNESIWKIETEVTDNLLDESEIKIPKEHLKAMGLGDITDCIPTWPDYIELEKDLMCIWPDDNEVSTVSDGIEIVIMPKGIKIYFKEDN